MKLVVSERKLKKYDPTTGDNDKYLDQLSGARSTQKLVKIHNNYGGKEKAWNKT